MFLFISLCVSEGGKEWERRRIWGCECQHIFAIAHVWSSEDNFGEVVLSSNHGFQGSKSGPRAPIANALTHLPIPLAWSHITVKTKCLLWSLLTVTEYLPNRSNLRMEIVTLTHSLGGDSPSWRSSQWLGTPHILLEQEADSTGQKWGCAITLKSLSPVKYAVSPIFHPKDLQRPKTVLPDGDPVFKTWACNRHYRVKAQCFLTTLIQQHYQTLPGQASLFIKVHEVFELEWTSGITSMNLSEWISQTPL